MKRAIITGATGAIGTALIQELIDRNIEILVLCREGSARNKQIPIHPLVSLKYCSLNQLSELVNDTEKDYDVFYHFAWEGTTGQARDDMYLQNQNVKYALDAVACAKRFGCKKFIGAGSQAEYGRVEGVLKPDTPTFPETGYGIAKLCAGQMTREYAHSLGMEHIWVRILSVYGPNDAPQSMIMSTINKLRNNEVPQFTKGEQMWDYLYSGDAAKAFEKLGNSNIDGETYILSSGKGYRLKEYILKIAKIMNYDGNMDFGKIPYSNKQSMYLLGDIKKLKNDIKWEPTTNFEVGINQILKFEKKGN